MEQLLLHTVDEGVGVNVSIGGLFFLFVFCPCSVIAQKTFISWLNRVYVSVRRMMVLRCKR